MPKGSAALTKARREEIVQACARLYETRSFREITLKEIGEQTTFTRTSIYNYFQTKEEIFLALLAREHDAWAADMEDMTSAHDALSADAFADAFARAHRAGNSVDIQLTSLPAGWSSRSGSGRTVSKASAPSRTVPITQSPRWMCPSRISSLSASSTIR